MSRQGASARVQQAASLLGGTQLFGGLDGDALDSLAAKTTDRAYRKGHIIFHQGDLQESLFIVAEGSIKIFVTSEDGDEMVLATLGPGEVFGDISLLDGGPRSASAETLESARLITLSRRTLLELMREHPAVTDALLTSLGHMIRRLTERASDLVFLDLTGRLAKLLLSFAEEIGSDFENGTMLDLQLTQTDLAAMVGGTRQSVNQILRNFERRGYLELRGRRIIVKSADALTRLSER